MSRARRLLALAAMAFALAACSVQATVVGAAARLGVAAAQDRGVGGAIDDAAIQLALNKAWLDSDFAMFWRLESMVRDGRVVALGRAASVEMRDEALRLAGQVDGVVALYGHISVDGAGSALDLAQDLWLSNRLQATLLFDTEIVSINYTVSAHDSVIYVLGAARDAAERERVIAHARDVPYVRDVVAHVRLLGEPV